MEQFKVIGTNFKEAFTGYRGCGLVTRIAEDKYLELRDAKSNGCCFGLPLIEILAYDNKIIAAHKEVLEAIENEKLQRKHLATFNFDDECYEYAKDILDMTLGMPGSLDSDTLGELEEIYHNIEAGLPITAREATALIPLVEIWGADPDEIMYTKDFVERFTDKLHAVI